jgi:heavy metal translocating P-type ATPase
VTREVLLSYGRPLVAAVLLFTGAIAGPLAWWIGLVGLGVPMVVRTLFGMVKGRFAADVVAALAVMTAIVLQQPLAGLVIVLMQTGGEALDRYAEGRASEAVRTLEADAPRTARRRQGDGWVNIAADAIAVGDELLIRPGEMLPSDGVVVEGRGGVDASRLTGEPLPVPAAPGTALLSGSLALEQPLIIRATRLASESQYARIVQLVRTAQASKAPLQREADRWAVWFTPVTLVVCAVAWLISRDPLRVLAVLVVATPCPLILAAPVAIIGGIDRGARLGLIFRHGTALEQLGRATTALLDKTGTLTIGRPELARVEPLGDRTPDQILAQVAAVEVGSGHHLARSVVAAAEKAGLPIPTADDIREYPGRGVAGTISGVPVVLGALPLIEELSPKAAEAFRAHPSRPGLVSFVTIGGRAEGVLHFDDRIREDAAGTLAALRALGFRRIRLVSGDHAGHAESVARDLGIAQVDGDLLPEQKLEIVRALQQEGERVLMVGDGTNDAPALSTADVGVALAAHGGGVSAEAAGLVLLQDDLARLPLAIRLSRRTLRVARQSIGVGLGLSALGMVAAAAGYLTPVAGAVAQEVIDVAVIVWALRAATPLPELRT